MAKIKARYTISAKIERERDTLVMHIVYFFPIRFHVFAVEFKFALEDVQDVIKVKGEPIQSIKFTFDSDTVIGQQNTVGKLRRKCSNYCAKEMF